MPLPVTTPTRPTCTRGAPHCTLSNRCPRKPPPSPRQPRRGCTTSHPRPQIPPLPATLTHTQGAQHCTLDRHHCLSPIAQPSTRSPAVGQLTQAHRRSERRHLATAPRNAIGHTADQAFPPTFLIQVIPCHVNQRPLRIAEQFYAPLIVFPRLCMVPPVVFHSDAPLWECKVEIIALLRTTLIHNINRHVDRGTRQAVALQQKPHLCLGRRIRPFTHEV